MHQVVRFQARRRKLSITPFVMLSLSRWFELCIRPWWAAWVCWRDVSYLRELCFLLTLTLQALTHLAVWPFTPERTVAEHVKEWAESGFLDRWWLLWYYARTYSPNGWSGWRCNSSPVPNFCRVVYPVPLTIAKESLFVNVGERTNVTGSARFKRLIKEELYDEALSVAREQVENGARIIDINMDEGMLNAEGVYG